MQSNQTEGRIIKNEVNDMISAAPPPTLFFSKEIQRESVNYLNKLFTFNDYFQLFFAHYNCYIFLNKCSQVCLPAENIG